MYLKSYSLYRYKKNIRNAGELKVPQRLYEEAARFVVDQAGGYILKDVSRAQAYWESQRRKIEPLRTIYAEKSEEIIDFFQNSPPGTNYKADFGDMDAPEVALTLSSLSKLFGESFDSSELNYIFFQMHNIDGDNFYSGGHKLSEGTAEHKALVALQHIAETATYILSNIEGYIAQGKGILETLQKFGVQEPRSLTQVMSSFPSYFEDLQAWQDIKNRDFSTTNPLEDSWYNKFSDILSLEPGEDSDEYGLAKGKFFIHKLSDEERGAMGNKFSYYAQVSTDSDTFRINSDNLTDLLLDVNNQLSDMQITDFEDQEAESYYKRIEGPALDFIRGRSKAFAESEGVSTPEYLLKQGGFDNVSVILDLKNSSKRGSGVYSGSKKVLVIYENFDNIFLDKDRVRLEATGDDIAERILRMLDTLRHELQHHVQYALSYVLAFHGKGKSMFGYTNENMRSKRYDLGGSEIPEESDRLDEPTLLSEKQMHKSDDPRIHHPLREVEFYARLSDAIEESKKGLRKYRGDKPLELLKYVTYQQYFPKIENMPIDIAYSFTNHFPYTTDFFESLRKHQPKKWRKAVSEYLKEILPLVTSK